ncbi:MAG: hypothetical protein NC543_11925 [bacterium]|nr:hypothetical protein [bacterium]MCM1376069.1 hypothetical protein [Muribaculum sp.]
MEHVVYLMMKKGGRGRREPVAVEQLQLEQTTLSRVTLLEPYLEAWQQPSHVCGVIWDKIKESYLQKRAGELAGAGEDRRVPGMRELHRYFPDYQVWDGSFRGYLHRRKLTGEWMRVWRVPVFDQYGSGCLQTLMKNVEGWQKLSQIVILGFSPDILDCMPRLARRAREIHFYLDYEPRDMEELQEKVDDEYGFVTQWRILEDRAADDGQQEHSDRKVAAYPGLGRYLHRYEVPCLVIDFTDTAGIPMTGLKPGSMWWDMGAMEEKRHLLEDRPLGVQYVSLKTLWRDMK